MLSDLAGRKRGSPDFNGCKTKSVHAPKKSLEVKNREQKVSAGTEVAANRAVLSTHKLY
jgi:hypothetical protein